MNRAELLAMGLPEESLPEFQQLYHRDLRRAAQQRTDKTAAELRAAIVPLLATVKGEDSLRAILAAVAGHYLQELEKAAPNTDRDGGTEGEAAGAVPARPS